MRLGTKGPSLIARRIQQGKDSRDLPKLAKLVEKRDLLKLEVQALEKEVEQFRAQQQKQLNLLEKALHEKHERMHGLLAYGMATGGPSPDAALLFNTPGDLLGAKTEGDRASANKPFCATACSFSFGVPTLRQRSRVGRLSDELDKLGRMSRNAHGGVEGEMKRRAIRAADPAKYNAAQTRLAQLRQEAMALVAPVLRRVLVSYSESLAQAAVEAEARLETNGLPIRKGNQWVLHQDAICMALLSCRVKVEKALFELQPLGAVGAVQFFLCFQEQEPHTPFNWPS